MGRDSSGGIATRYGLDDQGIESRWGEVFRTRPERSWGLKRSGLGVDHPAHLAPKVKERVQLYLYSLSGSSWPVLGSSLLS